MRNFVLAITLILCSSLYGQKTITFESSDGLDVTADLYIVHKKSAPFIVLFHQANWSRGEYQEIAPKLNAMGYNCMAVDQRSGGAVNGVQNKTRQSAVKELKATSYVDALPDMMAAIKHAKTNFVEGKLILWGSSYSSALVIRILGDNPEIADAGLAFAPGEYFANQGKTRQWIAEGAEKINKPVFITSAKNEKNAWWKIYEAIPVESKSYFLPETMGNHGSRALWEKFNDSRDYWSAVTNFLNSLG